MNYFTLDGHRTTEWGIGLSAGGAYDAPARKGESISVPGRNGNIWVDDGSYENVMVTYPCWMSKDFDVNIDGFRAYLSLHSDQYYELRDSYHPNEYRMARYAGAFTPQPGTQNESGRFDVTFDCMPQRFLDSGNTWEPLTIGGTTRVTNPTHFPSPPVICLQRSSEDATPMTFSLRFADYSGDTMTQCRIRMQVVSTHPYYIDTADLSVRVDDTSDVPGDEYWYTFPRANVLPTITGDPNGLILRADAITYINDGSTDTTTPPLEYLAILPRWYTI